MKFKTTRFGTIDVSSEEIYIFPDGPLGFPECTRFTFVDEEGTYPFRMMQSLDNPAFAFVVVDPLSVRTDYSFDVTKEDLALLKAEDVDGLVVYAIVTMAKELESITLNLQGPIIVNPKTRLGHQFVLVNTPYTTREPMLGEEKQIQESQRVTEESTGMITKKAV